MSLWIWEKKRFQHAMLADAVECLARSCTVVMLVNQLPVILRLVWRKNNGKLNCADGAPVNILIGADENLFLQHLADGPALQGPVGRGPRLRLSLCRDQRL